MSKTNMEYSVLMTVYKGDSLAFFKEALLSMIHQTITPSEIILVEDGPIPSGIKDIVSKLNKQYGIIKEVPLKNNVGLGAALNEGIKYCSCELIARMDADDISAPTRCEKQLQAFQADKDLDIVGCPVKEFVGDITNIVGERNVPIDNESIYKYAKTRDPFNHPTVMYKKSSIEKVGCYSNMRKNQDTDLWIKLLTNGAKCQNIDEHLLFFRFDENTYKKRKSWLNTKLLIGIRWRAFRKGFCSFADFLQVSTAQLAMFILPVSFQKLIYTNILRKTKRSDSI